jgi:hypothetical protein
MHTAMNIKGKEDSLASLSQGKEDLEQVARISENVVNGATNAFKALAGEAAAVLSQAANIIDRIQHERMRTVLDRVQAGSVAVRNFLERRLQAVNTILIALQKERNLLQQLTTITQRQETVAHHLRALSVFTNIEVAHLGTVGGDFRLLAQELAAFSRFLSVQTLQLAADTQEREQVVTETWKILSATLPQLRSELVHIEEDIARAEAAIETDLRQQNDVVARFQTGAQQTEQEIAGAVAAIQAHDITRQQIEHVQHALTLIASKISGEETAQDHPLGFASAGLTIQGAQLKTIKTTIENWTSQIGRCMTAIRQLSASDVINVGPIVLRQERELSSQLAHIEILQQKSQEYGGKMQSTLAGLSTMAEQINGHLRQSHAIRDRLRLLMFNSLIEAHRLGARGIVVSAIASLIRGVSEQWNLITDHSKLTLNEMNNLVDQTNRVMEVFSEASHKTMREDQEQTRAALDEVRNGAAFVAEEAAQIQTLATRMQAGLVDVDNTETELESCFSHLDNAVARVESVLKVLATEGPGNSEDRDMAEIERSFSSFYTNEIEREVMRAALHGAPLPVLQQSFTGNSVELF